MKGLVRNLIPLICITTVYGDILGDFGDQKGCIPQDFGYSSFVCVCNTTYCDTLPPAKKTLDGTILKITTNKEDKRWFMEESSFQETGEHQSSYECDVVVTINREKKFQKIFGFGGAFTDSSGINIRGLPQSLQDFVLRGYYSEEGLEYNLGRVPIAGTDFSTHPYSYDDLPPGQTDPALQNFSLTKEDFQYKIPYIKIAQQLSSSRGATLSLFASPWSGPGWMKDNGLINGNGRLKKEFYPVWASYIVKFLREYEKRGIAFNAMTTQNEPTAGLLFFYSFNEMAWLPEEQGVWVAQNLGPQLKNSGYKNVTIFIHDDQRRFLPIWPIKVMSQPNASQYIGGIAVHWYWDFLAPAKLLDLTHQSFPDLPILYTEACTGYGFWNFINVKLGSWERGESYAKSITETLQHWVVGWTDWNLALNLEGGPNWAKNFVDSPVIVNQEKQEIYRQPMYYFLAHFSKVIPEGSQRIASDVEGEKQKDVHVITFVRPDNATAAIALNLNDYSVNFELQDGDRSHQTVLDQRSITSFVW